MLLNIEICWKIIKFKILIKKYLEGYIYIVIMFKYVKISRKLFSETLNNNFSTLFKTFKGIRPSTKTDLGYYLAGLIEGDGHISSQNQIVITFHETDVSLAYFLKEIIGYGNINKIKNKKAFNFIVSNKEGLIKIINLINGKIKTDNKFNQLTKLYSRLNNHNIGLLLPIDKTPLVDNFWLAGFTDADGSLQIKNIKRTRNNKIHESIKLNYQISQKERYVLDLIKNFIGGGYIGKRIHPKGQISYYYESTSFKNNNKVLEYLNKYNLQSSKYNKYLIYLEIQDMCNNKKHLTKEGLEKIKKLKTSLI